MIPPNEQHDTSFNEYAVIDMGSNSFHMIVAREVNDSLQIIYQLKHHVRLASGLTANNKLNKKSIERAINCLTLFSERIKNFPKKNVRIVATHALRVAKNSNEFLSAAAKVIPYPIEIISGKEEARLIYLGVAHTVPKTDMKLVVDIGGGSTEIAVGKAFDTLLVDSRPMGCVTYTEQFFPDKKFDEQSFKLAKLSAIQLLEKISPTAKSLQVNTAFGTSGTIKGIRNLLIDLGALDGIITYQRLNDLYRQLLTYKSFNHIDFPSISDERKLIIFAGLAILMGLFETLDIKELHYCSSALREGVLYEMIEHLRFRDIRQHTAITLSKQYNIDNVHAQKVVNVAKYFYAQWRPQARLQLDETLEPLLYWAAMLHEIGLNINYSSIHKHSAYILMNSNLPGFNQEQQLLLATLVRNHRKSLKEDNIPFFNLFERSQVMPMIQLLRLAILINNQRQLDLPVEAFTIKLDKDKLKRIELVINKQVADKNQLILLDLEQEQAYWKQMNGWHLSITISEDSLSR